jgi:Lrp/AsnC family transcriptional regulator, leucine-responsive regulatory protein
MPPSRRTIGKTAPFPSHEKADALAQSAAVPLDDVDRQILVLLSEDSRRSQRALASELGMSAPAVRDRIGRLERLGVIRGYGIQVDWSAVGYPMTVYLTITAVRGYQQREIVDQIAQMPEVEWLVIVTGGFDMLARLRIHDHAHLRRVLVNQLWKIEGVQRAETSLAIVEIGPKNLVAELLAVPPKDQT